MASLPLPVSSYRLRSTPASTARLVNVYPEALPPGAKSRLVLTRAPGVRPLATVGTGPIRGMHQAFDNLYVVSGTSLYKVDSDGTATSLGSIPGTGAVSMAHNTAAIVVVAQPNAYWSDGASGVTQITDADYTSRGAKYVKFCDNYMLFMEPNSGRFFGADLNSVTDFDSLNFATAEGNPDYLVGMEVDHRQVVLLGTVSGEIWENTGASGFPFERSINGFFERGCFNGDTIAKMDNSLFWVADNYTVCRLVGATPQRISTHAVEQFLSTVDVTTLRAFAYTQDGHSFYVLCCSTGCFVYDATSNEWAERATYPYDYFRWQYHAPAHGRQYVGDYYTGEVGYFDPTYYLDGTGIQRCEWQYQAVYSENKRALHRRLEIVPEVGVGLTTGQGSDPEIMLASSDDGGQTWTNHANKKLGAMGRYLDRVWWTGLGSARQRVYRAAVSDPVRLAITETTIEADGGRI
jgi:hypothetical protein